MGAAGSIAGGVMQSGAPEGRERDERGQCGGDERVELPDVAGVAGVERERDIAYVMP